MVEQTVPADETLLFLGEVDWVNLAISVLIVVAGYLIGTWLIRRFLPRLVRRTKTTLDDQLLAVSGNQIRWLVVLLTLRFATERLTFIEAMFKTLLLDIYFFVGLFYVVSILWRLGDLAAKQAREQAAKSGQAERYESLIRLAIWGVRLAILVFALTLIFSHFAIDVTGITVFAAIFGATLALASRDALADFIAGVLILFDRPFRVGDRIELTDLNTTGDVVDVRMRSTMILTGNNRMVIYPNSQIGKNMIVNYAYPDPSFYDSTEIIVAYENDIERIIQIVTESVGQVEGVQKERGVDVRASTFTEYSMRLSIGWWIASYRDLYAIRGRVSQAALQALREANALLPYTKGNVNVQVNPPVNSEQE